MTASELHGIHPHFIIELMFYSVKWFYENGLENSHLHVKYSASEGKWYGERIYIMLVELPNLMTGEAAMANKEQLAILKQGAAVWNKWIGLHPDTEIDLEWAELIQADLSGIDLADAEMFGANLYGAKLSGADLSGANLSGSVLSYADLTGAKLRGTTLSIANLVLANFSRTDLSNADLRVSMMVETNFSYADLSNAQIYGISAWKVNLEGTIQSNLVITDYKEAEITVDNLEVAQFIYLLLNNQKLRDVIDTVGKKAVLILGRFTEERKAVLDAIRDELRKRDYIPILFDFEKPSSRDVTETVSTLAHMARFVIADLTDAKSIPQELAQIVPHLPSIAVQPLILQGQREYGMFEHWQRYGWVLPIHVYENQVGLIAELGEKVIAPAEAKVDVLRQVK